MKGEVVLEAKNLTRHYTVERGTFQKPAVLKALDGLDIRSECAKIKHPVLVLHGEHDQLLPMADSKAMAALIPNAQFEVIPGQGHCTNAENPTRFVEIVNGFFGA